MQHLLDLDVKSTASREQHMTKLVSSLHMMPLRILRHLDISGNKAEAGRTIPILATNLSKCQTLRVLCVNNMQVPAHDMEILARNLPPHLIGLSIDGNEMNEVVATHLIDTLPHTLNHLLISVHHLSVGKHDELLHSIHSKLTRLQTLYVRDSPYPAYLLKHGGQALAKCAHLYDLLLASTSSDLMTKESMELFMEGMQRARNVEKLSLYGIRLDKEAFKDLIQICRQKSLQKLR